MISVDRLSKYQDRLLPLLLLVAVLVLLIGCAEQEEVPPGFEEPIVLESPATETPEAEEEATETPEGTETPEAAEEVEATETPEGTETPEAPEEEEGTATPERAEAERATTTPEGMELLVPEEEEAAGVTATPTEEEATVTPTPEEEEEDEEATVTPTPEAEEDEGPTAGSLADAGQEVYMAECARCHGEEGEGVTAPAVIGDNANLAKYNTAQGLYDYVSSAMPLDAPGSLSDQEYLQVVTHLLLQNDFVDEDRSVTQGQLSDISLE